MKTAVPTDAEKRHAAKVGKPFADALARATMCVRSNAKLIGADKLRACIAWHAALSVTGYDRKFDGFVIPEKGCGDPTQEMTDITAGVFRQAIEAAQTAVPSAERSST